MAVLAVAALLGCGRRKPAGLPVDVLQSKPGVLEVFPEFAPDGTHYAFSSTLRGSLEIFVRNLATPDQTVQITKNGSQNIQPSFSPDGDEIAFHSRRLGGIWKTGLDGAEPRMLADFGSSPAWSPKGKEIIFQSLPAADVLATSAPAAPPSTLWIVRANGGAPRAITKEGEPPGGHGAPVWDPGGKWIYFIASDPRAISSELWRVTPDGAQLEKVFAAARIFDPAVSPDGDWIYFGGYTASNRYAIMRIPLRKIPVASSPEIVTKPGLEVARHPALARSGRLLWSSLVTSGNLWSLPLDPATSLPNGPLVPLTAGSGRSTWPVFSRDGKRLAFSRTLPGQNADIWVMNLNGSGAEPLTSNPAVEYLVSWLPDNRRVLFVSFRTKPYAFWSVDSVTKEEVMQPFNVAEAENPQLSPDGKRMAYHSRRGGFTMNIWIRDLVKETDTQLTFDREFIGFPSWSPDGKTLLVQVRQGEDVNVATMSPEGGDPVLLTSARGLHWPFNFSPDGSKISYASFAGDAWNVHWVERATRKKQALTNFGPRLDAYLRYPAWSPLGNQIVFERAETAGAIWLRDYKE